MGALMEEGTTICCSGKDTVALEEKKKTSKRER
jgi:hypothetical protein